MKEKTKKKAVESEERKPMSYEETLRFLLSANGKEKDIALADDLLAEYFKLSDAFRDYRFEKMSDATRALVEVARDLSTSRLTRKSPDRRHKIDTPEKAGEFFLDWFKGLDREEMAALYLDSNKNSIECVTISRGSERSVNIDVRKIVGRAMALEATYVIIAHNHPHTPLLPSRSDLDGTVVVSWSTRMTNVELLDHIVVYGNDFISLHESSLLSKDRRLSGAKFSLVDGELIGKLGGSY